MRLLVLGGTKFLGRAVVEDALARGHEVTTFSRGATNPGLFPAAEMLYGDRDGGLGPLGDRLWDAVVDTSGFVPRIVRQSAELLRDSVGRVFSVAGDGVGDPPGRVHVAPVQLAEGVGAARRRSKDQVCVRHGVRVG